MVKNNNKVTVSLFNKMFAIRYFLYLAYTSGWIFFTFFIFLDLSQGGSLDIDNKVFLSFFLFSLVAFISYFLVLFLLIKMKKIKLKPVLKSFLAVVVVTLAFLLLQFIGLLKVYGIINISFKTIFFSFFPASVVFGFVGIGVSSQLFINWQKAFLKSQKVSSRPKK